MTYQVWSRHLGRVSAQLLITLAFHALAVNASFAQTYEQFVCAPNAPISSCGSGPGWATPVWNGGSGVITNTGLTYSTLAVAGRALGPCGNFTQRALLNPIVGTPGACVLLRALMRSDVAGTPGTQATLGNSSGGTFIIGDLPQPDAAAGNWGFQNSFGRFYSTIPVAANTTTYLVARIDFASGNDQMRLWVNPPVTPTLPTGAADVNVTNADVAQFSGVFWQTQQGQIVDEIHIDSCASLICAQPPTTTMVAWYPFDELTGPTATNLATGNPGAHQNNPTPVSAMVANGLAFDGFDDYVESPSTIATNFGPAGPPNSTGCAGPYSSCSGSFSIETWIRIDPSAPLGVMVIVDKRVSSGGKPLGYSFFVRRDGGGDRIGLQLGDALGPAGYTNYVSPPTVPALADGNWHHVGVTVERQNASGIVWFYDGSPMGGNNNPTLRSGSLVNNSPLRIGTRTAFSPLTGWLDGELDELEIFNRALVPSEILAIFNAGTAGKCKP
jgi:hypothetical protein